MQSYIVLDPEGSVTSEAIRNHHVYNLTGSTMLHAGLALVQEEAVECAHGEDFGVPIVDGVAVGMGESGRRETFHARAVR